MIATRLCAPLTSTVIPQRGLLPPSLHPEGRFDVTGLGEERSIEDFDEAIHVNSVRTIMYITHFHDVPLVVGALDDRAQTCYSQVVAKTPLGLPFRQHEDLTQGGLLTQDFLHGRCVLGR